MIYKYRGGNEELFKRDLKALEESYFYAPTYEELNDPCEAMVLSDRMDAQTNAIGKLFGGDQQVLNDFKEATQDVISSRNSIGIYSLSNSKINELLWAHYASGHRGFCVGYETDEIVLNNMYQKLRSFPVKYSNRLPKLSVLDINNDDKMVNKLIGTKSKLWSYEKETRIISDFVGYNFYEYSALKTICFGLKMKDEQKNQLMDRLKGRGIQYSQITQKKSTYKFGIKEVPDLFSGCRPYIGELQTDSSSISYCIEKKEFKRNDRKGQITIYLNERISEKDLILLGKDVKNKLFHMAERVYMFYLLEGMIDGSGCWAYTHYNFGAWENSIQGLTLEQEKDLIDKLRNNTRNAIGTWLDDRFGVGSSLQLYKENGRFFMEANFPDKSVHIEEVIESQFDEIRRFVPVEDNGHGEYFEVDKTGELKYYSPDGLFKTLTPFLL